MKSEQALLLLAGVAVGFVVARFLISPGTSDRLVAQGVRDKIESKLGPGAAEAYDVLGLGTYAPGIAAIFG